VGILLTLAGVSWVVAEKNHQPTHQGPTLQGVAFGVGAALCQGLGLVLSKMGMATGIGPWPASWVRMGMATAVLWLVCLASGTLSPTNLLAGLRQAGVYVFFGAILGPFLGASLSLVAAQRTQVGIAATLMATTPILVIPLVVISQGYRPTVRALLGTSAAVLGVALLFSH
jgi:drug/metabolite transporter (DMT)-like permease